jgi:hypothetical protein
MGSWGSLFKSRITNSVALVERPQTRKYKATEQAVRTKVAMKRLLWGLPTSGGLSRDKFYPPEAG